MLETSTVVVEAGTRLQRGTDAREAIDSRRSFVLVEA